MKYTFIDLFAGIGGFHLGLHNVGMKCVFASEIDESARKSYESNFKKVSPELFENNLFNKDICELNTDDIQVQSYMEDFLVSHSVRLERKKDLARNSRVGEIYFMRF